MSSRNTVPYHNLDLNTLSRHDHVTVVLIKYSFSRISLLAVLRQLTAIADLYLYL
jgi:hypothetical protein